MAVEISDWNDLDNVRNDLTADYVLVNDLDEDTDGYDNVASPTANNGQGFDPIGNEEFGEEVFTGSFDGQGNTIYDLTIDRSGRRLIAMFAKASDIQNLNVLNSTINVDHDDNTHAILAASDPATVEAEMNLENCTVSGSITLVGGGDRVGGLVGQLFDVGTIQNCVSHVDVTSDGDNVGGLVGQNNDTVKNSYATGSVEGDREVGGLVGENTDTVTDSYATGSVEGDSNVGGLVGENVDTVTDSYATGSVGGDERVGGLVGLNRDTITESYATGSVEGNERVGGLVGRDLRGPNDISNSYADSETTSQNVAVGTEDDDEYTNVTTLTTAEMQGSAAETNMDGFDFANVWDSVLESDDDTSADGYPILIALDRENQLDAQGILILFDLTVETNPATDVSAFGATLNGELVELDEEADDADVFFEFGEDVADSQTPIQTLTGPATFDELVDELTNDTTFEFRAVAEAQDADNETFTDEGDILTFTTDDTQIDIQTDAATDVEAFEATLNGEVVNLGAYDSAETFFEYGSINVDDEVTDVSIIETAQTLSEVVKLAQDSEYEFRAVAIGENDGVRYEGDILTFDTEIVTLDGTISLDEAGVENADVLVHNFTQDVFEGRLSTDADGNYAVDLPDADRLDTVAVAVDFDDGTERYGRVVTTVLE